MVVNVVVSVVASAFVCDVVGAVVTVAVGDVVGVVDIGVVVWMVVVERDGCSVVID